ncbi:hypothetical protein HKD37_06G015237 [Glycine soja]
MSYGGAVPFAESKRGLVKFPFIALAAVQPRTVHRQSSGIENSSNPPKLRRNASTTCDTISTSQYGPSDPGNQLNWGTTRDQIMSERKRRQLMAERFIAFSSIIPGLKVSA